MVPAGQVFAAMRQAESAGMPVRFPHPPQLYGLLLSKEWQAHLCQAKQYRVPPTTLVPRGAIARDPRRAAGTALEALDAIRSAVGARRHESAEGPGAASRVVAKLGHAWEAAHVRVLDRSAPPLTTALAELCREVGSEHGCVIVQDFAPNDFELRAYVVRGVAAHAVYSNFERFDGDGYPRWFVQKSRREAVRDWLHGDDACMDAAERRVIKLVEVWLAWLRSVSAAPVPAIRMDFLVKRTAAGKASVRTLELTELGFSLLGWGDGPRQVLGALLESCFDDTGPSAAEAEMLRIQRECKPLRGQGKAGASEPLVSRKKRPRIDATPPSSSPSTEV